MDKRYQVFVSSTYTDLQEERQLVTKALMEIDCIPSGMELFPAVDEEQWSFIKKIIDDCDYYLLIIGGRYGSTTSEGISYTEKEFDYALEIGLKVIALIHGSPEEISFKHSEADSELRKKLEDFKGKVKTNRLVKFWNEAKELPGLVLQSVLVTIKTHPAIGWVRADKIANETLVELNELRKENKNLQDRIAEISDQVPEVSLENIADIDSIFVINSRYTYGDDSKSWITEVSWIDIFYIISPYLIEFKNEDSVKSVLEEYILKRRGKSFGLLRVDDQDLQTISIQ